MPRTIPSLILVLLFGATAALAESEDWTRWGGPRADFSVTDPGLADTWPEEGLPILWERPLGEGYSGISVADGRLFTSFREGTDEILISADTARGDVLWTHRVDATPLEGMRLGFGEGPHSTPTVVGDVVVFVGTTSRVTVLDTRSGDLVWSLDLWAERPSGRLRRGYGSSPVVHSGRVLVPVGKEGGVVALQLEDGRTAWEQAGVSSAQSTPLLVRVEGREHLVIFAQDEVVGLDPTDGKVEWRLPHDSFGPYNISTPLYDEGGLLFVSSAYGGGGQGIRLSLSDDGVRAESAWTSNRLGIHFTNAVRTGDVIVGSSGRSTIVTTALRASDGETVWRTRDLDRANFLRIGDRLLALEEGGRLLLLRPTPAGPSVLAEDRIRNGKTWTIPTLVGNVLYVRDRRSLVAFELPVDEGIAAEPVRRR